MTKVEKLEPIGIIFGKTDPFSIRAIKLRDAPIINVGQLILLEEYSPKSKSKEANILGRITWISMDNRLLSSTDLIPNISREQTKDQIIMGNIKYAQSVASNTVFEVQIIGKFKVQKKNGESKLIRPSAPIISGQMVYFADKEFLEEQIYKKNIIEIGYLRDNKDVKANVDFNKLITHHFSVLAMTGAGKSYTVGVIIEELMSKYEIPILIIDPHGEYCNTCMAENDTKLANKIADSVKIFIPGEKNPYIEKRFFDENKRERPVTVFKLNPSDLELYQVKTLLREYYGLSEAQSRELDQNWDRLILEEVDFKTSDHLAEYICEDVTPQSTQRALQAKLRALFKRPYFDVNMDIPIRNLISKGKISILELNNLDSFDQQAIVGIILRKLFESRKTRSKTRVKPFLTIIEEAHNFIPGGTTHSASKYVLSRIASEGRKFGIGIGVVSQRPYKVDSDVLSQCNTHFILRIMNPKDQNYVKNICEYMTEEDAKSLRGQAQGEAMVIGYATPFTLLVSVKERLTKHGGVTPDFLEELNE